MMIELIPGDVCNALVNDKHLSCAFSAHKGVIIIRLYKAQAIFLPRGDSGLLLPLPRWVYRLLRDEELSNLLTLYLTGSRPKRRIDIAIKWHLLRESLRHPDCKSENERLACIKGFSIQVRSFIVIFYFGETAKWGNRQTREKAVANKAAQLQAKISARRKGKLQKSECRDIFSFPAG